MKQLILFAAVLLAFNITGAQAQQTEIAAGKKAVIAEIIAVTSADKKGEETMLAIFKQMETIYPQMVENTLEKTLQGLSQAEKEKVKAEAIKKVTSMNSRFNQRLQQRVNFREYVEQAIYPLYDKFFTENELKELLAFYKTPIGQKLNDISPQMAAEGSRLAQERLMPKIMKVIDELVQEDINEARGNQPAKKN